MTVQQVKQAIQDFSPEDKAKFFAWYSEHVATIESVERGIAEHDRGEGVPMRQAIEQLAAKKNVPLGEQV